MKKIFFIAVCTSFMAIVNNTLFAQTEQSTWLLGGSAALANTSTDSDDIFSMNISPSVGYFVIDNFSVGAEIPFTYSSFDNFNSSSIGFLPSLRYYLGNNENLKFFLNAFGGVVSDRTSFDSAGDAITSTNTVFGGRAGIAFFLNRSIALETAFSYQHVNPEDRESVNQLGLSVGFQIHFGGNSDE